MNMREFLSWAQRHYRIDVTISTVERKSGGMASTGTVPGRCDVPGLRARSAVPLAKKNVIRSDKTQLHIPIDTRTTGRATHTRHRRIVLNVELALIPFRVRSSTLSRQHVRLLRIVIKSGRIVR